MIEILEFVNTLVGLTLCYAIKSPDIDLYDFGFCDLSKIGNAQNNPKENCSHVLHILCRFKVIWKTSEHRVDTYFEDTPHEKFNCEILRLVGLNVKQVALSEKNDLWLDFGDYWMVFATFENACESWRLFLPGTNLPHLIASNSWLHFSM